MSFEEPDPSKGQFPLGQVPHNKKWDKERCLAKATEWFEKTGRPPASSEWQPQQMEARVEKGGLSAESALESLRLYEELGCPNYSIVYRLFGTWTAFLAELRLFPYFIQKKHYAWVLGRVRGE